jgi:hypothetical protein
LSPEKTPAVAPANASTKTGDFFSESDFELSIVDKSYAIPVGQSHPPSNPATTKNLHADELPPLMPSNPSIGANAMNPPDRPAMRQVVVAPLNKNIGDGPAIRQEHVAPTVSDASQQLLSRSFGGSRAELLVEKGRISMEICDLMELVEMGTADRSTESRLLSLKQRRKEIDGLLSASAVLTPGPPTVVARLIPKTPSSLVDPETPDQGAKGSKPREGDGLPSNSAWAATDFLWSRNVKKAMHQYTQFCAINAITTIH